MVTLVAIAAWPVVTRRKWRFRAALLVTCSGVLLGSWLYLVAPSTDWGWRLQELSVRYTSKNLFSGRQLYWDDLTAAVAERPLLGHGAGVEAQSVTGFSWSSHNLYLQTTLQVGAVGLVALFVLIWTLWRQLWRTRSTTAARVAGAFLVGTLVHQMFEVSLTQVNLANGFLIWLVLAIGINSLFKAAVGATLGSPAFRRGIMVTMVAAAVLGVAVSWLVPPLEFQWPELATEADS